MSTTILAKKHMQKAYDTEGGNIGRGKKATSKTHRQKYENGLQFNLGPLASLVILILTGGAQFILKFAYLMVFNFLGFDTFTI